MSRKEKSGGLDSNQRPLAPHTSALPDCATTRTIFSEEGCKYNGLPENSVILHKILVRGMNVLLRKVKIINPQSPHHLTTKDILIQNGNIAAIENEIQTDANKVVEGEDLHISNGWIDLFADFAEPGFEHRETLVSGANAAAAGGFTKVCILPNLNPVTQHKPQVDYFVSQSKNLKCELLPLGVISKNAEGKELAEMYDMFSAGAVAFTDGIAPVQSAGLMLKALQYVKAIQAPIFQMPVDQSISKFGLINEGIVSTQLGLPGIASIGEELMIERDIRLAAYTESKLHITGLSTARGLAIISKAKKEGIQVTCSVSPFHLLYCDEDLKTYNAHLKVHTPLRTKADQLALIEGVKDGSIDAVASHHIPQDWDGKTCEFEYAKKGMNTIETVFHAIKKAIPSISAERIVELLHSNPNKILGIKQSALQVGESANLTIFSMAKPFDYVLSQTKNKNNPLLNASLSGCVIGTYHSSTLNLN